MSVGISRHTLSTSAPQLSTSVLHISTSVLHDVEHDLAATFGVMCMLTGSAQRDGCHQVSDLK